MGIFFFSSHFLVCVFDNFGYPGPLIKHMSSLLKWTRSSSKAPQSGISKLFIYLFFICMCVCVYCIINHTHFMPYDMLFMQMGMFFNLRMVT
jgi:hypothetical protein